MSNTPLPPKSGPIGWRQAERLFPVAAVWNDRLGSALVQVFAQLGAIVGFVAEHPFRRLHSANEALCDRAIVRFTSGQSGRRGSALRDRVDARVLRSGTRTLSDPGRDDDLELSAFTFRPRKAYSHHGRLFTAEAAGPGSTRPPGASSTKPSPRKSRISNRCRSRPTAFSKIRNIVSKDVDVEDAITGGVRHAVEIAGNAHHPLMRGAPYSSASKASMTSSAVTSPRTRRRTVASDLDGARLEPDHGLLDAVDHGGTMSARRSLRAPWSASRRPTA